MGRYKPPAWVSTTSTIFISFYSDFYLFYFSSLCLCVGNSGDIEAETLALLLEHEVDYAPFPESVINDDLPSLPWSVPSEELKRRRDYRCETFISFIYFYHLF